MALLLRAHAPGRGCSACGFSDWYSTYRVAETTAAAKIIIDTASDQILGAHLLGPGYSELINSFGLAIKLGLTTRQLKSVTATYPSLGSDLGSLL